MRFSLSTITAAARHSEEEPDDEEFPFAADDNEDEPVGVIGGDAQEMPVCEPGTLTNLFFAIMAEVSENTGGQLLEPLDLTRTNAPADDLGSIEKARA